jgi:hypothetical protein
MGAQVVMEIYRTCECKDTNNFKAVVTLTYFGDTVFIQGMSGNFSKRCWLELYQYLTERGCTEAQFYRHGKLRIERVRD